MQKSYVIKKQILCLEDTHFNSEDFLCINLIKRNKKRASVYNTEAQFYCYKLSLTY